MLRDSSKVAEKCAGVAWSSLCAIVGGVLGRDFLASLRCFCYAFALACAMAARLCTVANLVELVVSKAQLCEGIAAL